MTGRRRGVLAVAALVGLLAVPLAGSPASAQQSPSPSAPSGPTLLVEPGVLTAGGQASVMVRSRPGAAVELLAYTRPSTELRTVRTGTADSDGRISWTVTPTANTRLVARSAGVQGPSVVLPVVPRTTLDLSEDGCTFSGAVYPAAAATGTVSLVRTVDERNVLLARPPVSDRGRWSVRRCLPGYTGDLVLRVVLPRSMTWSVSLVPAYTRRVPCLGPCLPGPDVVLDVDGPMPDRSVVLNRGQGLLLKVVTNPSTGYAVDAASSGRALVGPERTFLADPTPDGPRPGSGGRTFFRYVGARAGSATVLVTTTPPGRGRPSQQLLRLGVRVR